MTLTKFIKILQRLDKKAKYHPKSKRLDIRKAILECAVNDMYSPPNHRAKLTFDLEEKKKIKKKKTRKTGRKRRLK